ncbi:MAG: YybH family protein [Jatrophihabitantaceae bacterium]
MTDEAKVRQIVADRTRAMNEGDAAALVAGYAPDAVVYSLAPPLRQPAEGNSDVSALQAWFDGHGGRVGYAVADLDVTVSGDLALCTSLDRMGGADDSSGEQFELWFRATLALRRDGDTWRVVHDHRSTPFYMDGSFKAALDLKP